PAPSPPARRDRGGRRRACARTCGALLRGGRGSRWCWWRPWRTTLRRRCAWLPTLLYGAALIRAAFRRHPRAGGDPMTPARTTATVAAEVRHGAGGPDVRLLKAPPARE